MHSKPSSTPYRLAAILLAVTGVATGVLAGLSVPDFRLTSRLLSIAVATIAAALVCGALAQMTRIRRPGSSRDWRVTLLWGAHVVSHLRGGCFLSDLSGPSSATVVAAGFEGYPEVLDLSTDLIELRAENPLNHLFGRQLLLGTLLGGKALVSAEGRLSGFTGISAEPLVCEQLPRVSASRDHVVEQRS